MTLIQRTGPSTPVGPSQAPGALPGDFEARVWREGLRAQLDQLLQAIAVNALSPDAGVALTHEDWARCQNTIQAPVSAATSAALRLLATELEAALSREQPVLLRRLGDHRTRAELGYD